jgi:hypothetical protein
MGILKRTKEVMCAFCSEPRNNVLLRIGTYLLLVLAIPGLLLDVHIVPYMAAITGIIFAAKNAAPQTAATSFLPMFFMPFSPPMQADV